MSSFLRALVVVVVVVFLNAYPFVYSLSHQSGDRPLIHERDVGPKYGEADASSLRSHTRSLFFLRRPAKAIQTLQLVDTTTGNVVIELAGNGMTTIDSDALKGPTSTGGAAASTILPTLTVRALSQGTRTRSVRFVLETTASGNQQTTTSSLVEKSSPFLLCGKNKDGVIKACSQLGDYNAIHTITVTAYSCRNARCGASRAVTRSFTVRQTATSPSLQAAKPSPSPQIQPVVNPPVGPPVIAPPGTVPTARPVAVSLPTKAPVVERPVPATATTAPINIAVPPTAVAPVNTPPPASPPTTVAPINAAPIAAPQAAPISAPEAVPISAPVTAPISAPVPAPTRAPKAPTAPVLPIQYTCDSVSDACAFKFDGVCDAGKPSCLGKSDCFDCDPCRVTYNLQGCAACTSAGCVWCGKEALCLSPGIATSSTMACQASDFVADCSLSPVPLFSDPLYESMLWVFDMIRVRDVWKSGITGKGIGIRINDNGVDSSHPEFSSKFDAAASCSVSTPEPVSEGYNHGTACASLAAGSGNTSCSVGIAHEARVSSCRIYGENRDDLAVETFDSSFLYAKMDGMHVSSNSYGRPPCKGKSGRRRLDPLPCPFTGPSPSNPCLTSACAGVDWGNAGPNEECEFDVITYCAFAFEEDVAACISFLDLFVECEYIMQSPVELQALAKGVTDGRDGKGIIYVFASGNSFDRGGDVNFAGLLNNRFVISVGAVGKDMVHASYSTGGAALFVSAPGGDYETTPDFLVAKAGGGCEDGGDGTSYACPIVSGVVALMLEVNNQLSWRDVQGIIASTAQKVFPQDPSWTTNAAGFHHSYLYGFGIVDAAAAVEAARIWVNYKTEQQIIVESGSVNIAIPEFQSPSLVAESKVTVSAASGFVVESVNVYLDLTHASRGDLEIALISPQNTSSILAPGERPENTQLGDNERWRLLTVRNWDEAANGDWTLQMVDRSPGDLTSCVDLPRWNVTFPIQDGTNLTFKCVDFISNEACADGGQSPNFFTLFAGVASGVTDPKFNNTDGVSLTEACCACGGGRASSSVPDVLKSWRLAIYGRMV